MGRHVEGVDVALELHTPAFHQGRAPARDVREPDESPEAQREASEATAARASSTFTPTALASFVPYSALAT
ncbi:hypothetical protein WA016_06909 [Myxococcus stipitatus]